MNSKQKKMKKIKLTILGLLISLFSYSQDTTYVIIGGKDIGIFYKNTDSLISKTNNEFYKDEIFYIKKGKILILYLFDNCKKCNIKSKKRTLTLTFIDDSNININVFSQNNTLPFSGNDIKKVIVRIPENE